MNEIKITKLPVNIIANSAETFAKLEMDVLIYDTTALTISASTDCEIK